MEKRILVIDDEMAIVAGLAAMFELERIVARIIIVALLAWIPAGVTMA